MDLGEMKSAVLERYSILDLMKKCVPDVPVKKDGNIYRTLCPFPDHKEKQSSFNLWPETNTFYCFGCNVGGDVINLARRLNDIGYKEAVIMLGKDLGLDYTEKPEDPKVKAYKDMVYTRNIRYYNCLTGNSPQAQNAMAYLKDERGITESSILKFRLGLVPEDEYRTRTDIGGIGNRLVFPIFESGHDSQAKAVGMGYRTLSGEEPKYKNDPGQPKEGPLADVFVKGKLLYGFNLARASIRKRDHAIVVEGYMDVIAMHQAGLDNTVAAMGTAFTSDQMDLIFAQTRNIVLFMDGDAPGKKNMLRVLPELFEKGFNVKIVVAESGKDPADICLDMAFNDQAVKAFVSASAVPAALFLMEQATRNYEKLIIAERLKAIEAVMPVINKIANEEERDVFKNMLYRRLDMAS